MKILDRLRSLASAAPIEPQTIDPVYEVTPLDLEPNDYEASYSLIDEAEEEFDTGLQSHTIDGYRRRLPDVHEEIPPESYEHSGAMDDLDLR